MKIVDKLKAVLDPRGPLGEVLSPSDVFKSRAGLPVEAPHTVRDANFVPATTFVLAPAKFVAAADMAEVPYSRMRLVSRYVEEHYAPVYDTPRWSGMAEAIRAQTTVVGWNVTQRVRSPHCDCLQATLEMEHGKLVHRACGRARAHKTDEEFVEHIQRLQFTPADDMYNTYYPTIPGNDPVIMEDGKVLKGESVYKDGKCVHDGTIRGGTQMKHGRREWKEKTKNMVLWDKGVIKEREKAYAASQKKWLDDVRPMVVKANKQMLPNKIGEL